ncbi:AraC family transcriptional regulator [Gloeocapsa sp. BRSZ]
MLEKQPIVVDFTREEDALQIHPRGAILSSQNVNWNGVSLNYYRYPPDEFSTVYFKQHLLTINTEVPDSIQVEQTIGEKVETAQHTAGDIIVIPANTPYNARWNAEHSFIVLGVDPTVLMHHALETIEQDDIALSSHFTKTDPLIHGIGLALKAELESDCPDGRLYTDSITTTLFAHLLRHYSTQRASDRELKEGLPNRKLRKVMDYINEHLAEDLPLDEIANQIGMSQSHFFRLFRQSTGLSPHQYRLQQRIDRAKTLLLHSELSIAEIALSVGFCDQSHLARHMRRVLGVSPKQLRTSAS